MRKLGRPFAVAAGVAGLLLLLALTVLAAGLSPGASEGQPAALSIPIRKTPFLTWVESEGIPVYGGFVIDDLTKVQLGPWKRYGTLGAIINLEGAEGITTGMMWGVEPGQKSIPVHHLFEGRVVVLAGSGEARFWQEGGKPVTAFFKTGTLFPLPMNTWYQFVNTGKELARLFAVTSAPILMDMYRDMNFIFNANHKFGSRFNGAADYFKPEPVEFKVALKTANGYALSRTNLVPELLTVRLYPAGHGSQQTPWRQSGGSGTENHHYSMAFDNLDSHIELFQPRAYELAHHHKGGAYVMYISGEGYSLLWHKDYGTQPYAAGNGDKVIKVPWHVNTLFVPPTDWFHQHFNPSGIPGKFLKVGAFESRVFPTTSAQAFKEQRGFTISYENEDPMIKAIFEEEAKKRGGVSNMPTVEEVFRKAVEAVKKAKETGAKKK